jgi:hypothetical protein
MLGKKKPVNTAGQLEVKVKIAIAKLKRYKSPGSNKILAEQIQPGGEI